jgi:HlyD family secretion protein
LIASDVVGPTATTPVSARVTGTIEALHCDANMQVKAGQLCAKIDPRPYQIAVDQSRADLAAAEARLEKDNAELAQAKAAFESHEALAKRPAISRKATDKSRKAFERAQTQTKRDEARVAQLQAALHAAETNLGNTDLVSPTPCTPPASPGGEILEITYPTRFHPISKTLLVDGSQDGARKRIDLDLAAVVGANYPGVY